MKYLLKKSFTLIELMIVIVIIGILMAVTFPSYDKIQEKTQDREAAVALKYIRAAEKIYKMENGHYYPEVGSDSNIDTINSELKLSLSGSNWSYTVDADSAQAARKGKDKTWNIDLTDNTEELTCSGADCP